MEDKGGELSIRSYYHNGRLVVEAVGEATLYNQHVLAGAMRAGEPITGVTVDLRELRSLDSGVLGLLVHESKRLRSPGSPFAPRILVTRGDQPDRVLRLGSFDRILEIAHDLEDV